MVKIFQILYLVLVANYGVFGVKLNDMIKIEWEIDLEEEEIAITIKCQLTSGYCAIGLGSKMEGADIYAITFSGSSVNIGDYYSSGHGIVNLDTSEDGTNDIEKISSSLGSSSVEAKFKRKLKTGDSKDKEIVPNKKSSIITAYVDGSSGLTYHDTNRSIKQLTWSTSGTSDVETFESDDMTSHDHGVIMTIAWGPIAFLGIFVARYFKSRPWWFMVHFSCLLTSSLITIISSSVQYKDKERHYEKIDEDRTSHSRIGLALTSLVIAQIIFGMLTSYTKIFTKSTQLTILLIRLHKLIGYCMFIAGLRNLYLGWEIHDHSYLQYLMIILYTIIPISFVTAEIIQVFYKNKLKNPNSKLAIMSHFDVIEEVKKGKKLMFADDLVIDVGHFFRSHPGGSFMLIESLGEDTGKYMVGCSSYGGTLNPYAHSDKAFSMLPELAIGRIEPPHKYIKVPSDYNKVFMEFTLHSKVALNQHTYMIFFTSSEIKVNSRCKDPTWLGKHFMVAYEDKFGFVKRYYSALFTDFKKWTGTELEDENLETKRESKHMLKLIFKVYEGGKMSQHLNKLEPGSALKIKGPIGPGLLLKSLEGRYLALAGGTGLVPFLDLVHLAWKKYGTKSSEFLLILYVFFRTSEDGFALEALKNIAETCDWIDLNIVTDEYKDKKEIPNKIKDKIESGVDLAWICGPSGFNRHYADMLKRVGLDRYKIIVM